MIFGMGTPAPPMTPWAQAKYDAAIPGIGAGGNGPANPRAKPLGNDPIMICDPISYPRIILTAGMYGMQVVQLPKETLWLFDWFYTRREIWTDGRKLPDDPELRFYGYSIGHWDGDVFVVEAYRQLWTSGKMTLRWFQPDQLKARNSGWEDLREACACLPKRRGIKTWSGSPPAIRTRIRSNQEITKTLLSTPVQTLMNRRPAARGRRSRRRATAHRPRLG